MQEEYGKLADVNKSLERRINEILSQLVDKKKEALYFKELATDLENKNHELMAENSELNDEANDLENKFNILNKVYLNYQKQESSHNNEKIVELISECNLKQAEINDLKSKYEQSMSEISKLKYEISVESNKQTTKDMSNESLQISSFDFQTPSKREQIY